MNLTTETERQQAIFYIKGRLARLADRRVGLLDHYPARNGHMFAEMKVINSKIDRLLDHLSELEKGARLFSRENGIES